MAITAVNSGRAGKAPSAPTFVDIVDVTCDDSYPAAGWPLDLTDYLPIGATVLEVLAQSVHPSGYLPVYNKTSSKLEIWQGATGVLVDLTTADAMDGLVVRLTVLSQ